ncbi:MAG: bifunctional nuclease family protein [Candidatus Sumerlaeia bacterium]|nr:bifunctional nuclease family protein [Candidatus Sumerlaeia bacterium]
MLVEMEVRELQLSDLMPTQIVILEEKHGKRRFPIFIGPHEAAALDQAVHGRRNPRPLTHDLILNVLDGLNADLEAVCVSQLRDEVFYGQLHLRLPDQHQIQVDTRPSDAMVLAVKRGAPIFVAEEVFEAMTERDDGGL